MSKEYFYYDNDDYIVYYGSTTPDEREKGLVALRGCLERDGYIKKAKKTNNMGKKVSFMASIVCIFIMGYYVLFSPEKVSYAILWGVLSVFNFITFTNYNLRKHK